MHPYVLASTADHELSLLQKHAVRGAKRITSSSDVVFHSLSEMPYPCMTVNEHGALRSAVAILSTQRGYNVHSYLSDCNKHDQCALCLLRASPLALLPNHRTLAISHANAALNIDFHPNV